jgi:hypothetical protein
MPEDARIIITLQKKYTEDDVLTFYPTNEGFDVEFVQRTIGNKVSSYIVQEEVTGYLCRFLKSVTLDDGGCDFVQIDCPGYPTVMLKIANVERYIPILVDQIEAQMNNWPLESKISRYY